VWEESGEEVVPTPRNFVLIFVSKLSHFSRFTMTGAMREKAQIRLAALKASNNEKQKPATRITQNLLLFSFVRAHFLQLLAYKVPENCKQKWGLHQYDK